MSTSITTVSRNEHEPVSLLNARAELATLEETNYVVEQTLRKRDVPYDIFTDRGGKKLASTHERIVVPLIRQRVINHRAILRDGRIPVSERNVTEQHLDYIDRLLERSMQTQNDDASRCFMHSLFLFALILEPQLSKLFLRKPPPPHPFPNSREAAEYNAAQNATPPLADSVAMLSFLKQDLLPAVEGVVSGKTQRLNLQTWVAERALQYACRMPLSAGAPDARQ